ncbi:MAG TPA: M1 family metallopeptidase, partial [Chitinophagaceae bacterium]
MQKVFLLLLLCSTGFMLRAQPDRWQQRVKYTMDVNVDINSNRFSGKQRLEYTNNSPDTLGRVFYHLYWNAFQPNSMMDQRSLHMGGIELNGRPDWDSRVRDRIQKLTPDEIGYQHVKSIKMNGVTQTMKELETILEVTLTKPILPKSTVVFELEFEAQVPLQVRRSGRDNPVTGVRYSMSQWYPKMCEYDYEGWHPTPYIAREFYGVWGDYDVKITIDKNYLVGASGYLQNTAQIGYGYETPGTKVVQPAGKTLTWNFVAPNVHDFVWAADPEFRHISKRAANGTMINVIYNRDTKMLQRQYDLLSERAKAGYNNDVNFYIAGWDNQWINLLDAAVIVLPFMEARFGPYPYKQYSFIHGGDGGMEYPMATLINGPSLGTAFHEWMHSWYQMMMGTNESEYAWMDEGFTTFAEALVTQYYNATQAREKGAAAGLMDSLALGNTHSNANAKAYKGYFN